MVESNQRARCLCDKRERRREGERENREEEEGRRKEGKEEDALSRLGALFQGSFPPCPFFSASQPVG
jgi:hypothetical protein